MQDCQREEDHRRRPPLSLRPPRQEGQKPRTYHCKACGEHAATLWVRSPYRMSLVPQSYVMKRNFHMDHTDDGLARVADPGIFRRSCRQVSITFPIIAVIGPYPFPSVRHCWRSQTVTGN